VKVFEQSANLYPGVRLSVCGLGEVGGNGCSEHVICFQLASSRLFTAAAEFNPNIHQLNYIHRQQIQLAYFLNHVINNLKQHEQTERL
jgi:hypothetical protein